MPAEQVSKCLFYLLYLSPLEAEYIEWLDFI